MQTTAAAQTVPRCNAPSKQLFPSFHIVLDEPPEGVQEISKNRRINSSAFGKIEVIKHFLPGAAEFKPVCASLGHCMSFFTARFLRKSESVLI